MITEKNIADRAAQAADHIVRLLEQDEGRPGHLILEELIAREFESLVGLIPGWVEITPDTRPTADDADEHGLVAVRYDDGMVRLKVFDIAGKDIGATHYHPLAKCKPATPLFGEWILQQDGCNIMAASPKVRAKWFTDKHAEFERLFGASTRKADS